MRAWMAAGVGAGLVLCSAAWAASPFDGAYKGDYRLGGGGGSCPAGGPFTVRVADGKFEWVIGQDRTTVTIAADGSFSGQNGRRYLQGKAESGRITAQTLGAACNYTWALSR